MQKKHMVKISERIQFVGKQNEFSCPNLFINQYLYIMHLLNENQYI